MLRVAAALLLSSISFAQGPWVVGQPLRDLHLPTIEPDGKGISLGDLRGKRLLLIEFASW